MGNGSRCQSPVTADWVKRLGLMVGVAFRIQDVGLRIYDPVCRVPKPRVRVGMKGSRMSG